jgi:transketolase
MHYSELKQFKAEKLKEDQIAHIEKISRKTRCDIVKMITHSCSGHPGGALSSIDIYLMLWLCVNVSPEALNDPLRDRIIISHGHTSAAVYSALGNTGFLDINEAINGFRKDGGIFEGHPCTKVPGVEWCSGSLGQGLSVGCGFALAAKLEKQEYHVFVVMGDGEQGKGQLQEAREFAVKYGLSNLTAIVDYNTLQASGNLQDVMPQNIAEKYSSAGWNVLEIEGHDYQQLYISLRKTYLNKEKPTMILAKTIMGKGVSFIESNYEYHGKVFTKEQCEQAIAELNGNEADYSSEKTSECSNKQCEPVESRVKYGTPIIYGKNKQVDCRSAFGEALYDIAIANLENENITIAALDCDLAESVKVSKFGKRFPNNLIECGIQEHNAATVGAALSKAGILTFFADFGVFGIDETYGQHRMSDLNKTSLKLICTHNGLDVGEDGKTHQCIDYISLMSNLLGFKLIIPADANQTDRAIRYAATTSGNICVTMGRSKVPVLVGESGNEVFGEAYTFEYGKADWIRRGKDGTIITCGTMVHKAVNACNKLREAGISIGVLNLSCPLQPDVQNIREADGTGLIVTYEDHNVLTGLGSIIGTFLMENGLKCKFKRMGIIRYGVSANPDYQYKLQNLDEDSVVDLIKHQLKK